MPVVEHGEAGRSVASDLRHGRDAARRGAYFEREVGAALRAWLDNRPDRCHLFHDVVDLAHVDGAGLKPLRLGAYNIDHVVLTGTMWLLIDAKGCAMGRLGVRDGRGVLVKQDGTAMPQPWLDHNRTYTLAGALYRLTEEKAGALAWVVPDGTSLDASLADAQAFSRGSSYVLTAAEVRAGELDQVLTIPAKAADPGDVERIRRRLSDPGRSQSFKDPPPV